MIDFHCYIPFYDNTTIYVSILLFLETEFLLFVVISSIILLIPCILSWWALEFLEYTSMNLK